MSEVNVPLAKGSARLGFIGLGLMGRRLTQRLYGAGWNIRAWNRNPAPAQEIARSGIPVAPSLAALVSDSNMILSCLADDRAVRSTYLGEHGVLALAEPGSTIIEMSTISAALSLELHRVAGERGIQLLDVAISGSTPAVEAGTLTLFAGGRRSTFDQCSPVFESIAAQWFFIGADSAGIRMKLVVNLLLGVGLQALAEAVALGTYLKISEDVLLDVLSKTTVIPAALFGKFVKLRNRDYSPQFPLRLMSKDLNLVMEAAGTLAPVLSATRAAQIDFSGKALADGDLDVSFIVASLVSQIDGAERRKEE